LRFILEAAAEADSRIFDLMIQHRAKISALTSEQTVQERIRHACRATVEKAIEYQSAALLEEATGKMKKHHPVGAQDFTLRAEMDFALASADAKSYLKAGALFARKVENGSPEALNALARNLMLHFKEDAKAMEQAERLAAEAAKKGDSFIFHLSHAQILAANGKKDKAIQAANKALRLAEEEGESATYQVKRFLQLFES
jgi:tetratricopeptide (TPR) repeat protein